MSRLIAIAVVAAQVGLACASEAEDDGSPGSGGSAGSGATDGGGGTSGLDGGQWVTGGTGGVDGAAGTSTTGGASGTGGAGDGGGCSEAIYELSTGPVSGTADICCNAGDERLSVEDCAVGANHGADPVAPNCAHAWEGQNNGGDACAKVTCRKLVCG